MGIDSISIVIPTKNAGPDFDRVLSMLTSRQTKLKPEILVIDSGSVDETEEICRRYSVRFERIKPEEFGHGCTRNLGISRTKGEIICLLTQDAIPVDVNFLDSITEPFSREDVAGVVGRQIPRSDASLLTVRDVSRWVLGSPDGRISRIANQSEFETLSPLDRYLMSAFDNVCSAIRRSVWEKIPFSDVVFGEDIEWGYRALRCGYAIAYEPNAAVFHSHDRPIRYQFQRTRIDHYRLRELFGLETVPTALHIPGSILRQMVGDTCDLLQMRADFSSRLKELTRLPVRATAHTLGQYLGARAYRMGRSAEDLTAV
ncbi:MAG: glycosyltransferase [bacterium]